MVFMSEKYLTMNGIKKKVLNYFSKFIRIFGHLPFSLTFFQQLILIFGLLNRAFYFA